MFSHNGKGLQGFDYPVLHIVCTPLVYGAGLAMLLICYLLAEYAHWNRPSNWAHNWSTERQKQARLGLVQSLCACAVSCAVLVLYWVLFIPWFERIS